MSLIVIKLKKCVKKLWILNLYMLDCVRNCRKMQEMCEKAVSKECFMLKYCINKCKSQEMCDKAVDTCRSLLKFLPVWFVLMKMLKDLDNCCIYSFYSFYADSSKVHS